MTTSRYLRNTKFGKGWEWRFGVKEKTEKSTEFPKSAAVKAAPNLPAGSIGLLLKIRLRKEFQGLKK